MNGRTHVARFLPFYCTVRYATTPLLFALNDKRISRRRRALRPQ